MHRGIHSLLKQLRVGLVATSKFVPPSMGWIPDSPDPRDLTIRSPEIVALLLQLPRRRDKAGNLIDLRSDSEGDYFVVPDSQGCLNASSTFAILSMMEYFERRIFGRTYSGSRLFLYQVTRMFMSPAKSAIVDMGAELRATFKMLTKIGTPPERYWPYMDHDFLRLPGAFEYAVARPFHGLKYFRLDDPESNCDAIWERVQAFLAAGFPIVFGIPVPSSISLAADIPLRIDGDSYEGFQAIVAVGYHKDHYGKKKDAVLIRSSWGSHWGDNGNGWLPATYVRNGFARDFWSVIHADWLQSPELNRPACIVERTDAMNSH